MDVIFHIWHDGDPSVGIAGDSTQLELKNLPEPVDDPLYLLFIKETLQQAFRAIWDTRRVYIMTQAEMDSQRQGEELDAEYDKAMDAAHDED